jgi:uracil DNA glycosylase
VLLRKHPSLISASNKAFYNFETFTAVNRFLVQAQGKLIGENLEVVLAEFSTLS